MPIARAGDVERVRAFNRFWTRQIGVLGTKLLESPYSLTEARVLFELAQREPTEAGELKSDLGLDAGYLSRILGRFKAAKLLTTEALESDARRQLVRLTAKGRRAFESLDARSAQEVDALLGRLTQAARRRLVGAMGDILDVLDGAPPRRAPFLLRPPGPGDLGWVVQQHGRLYAAEYGWDETFEALVARIVSDYVEQRNPQRDGAWIAEVDGEPAGCVFCVAKSERVAQLRLLLTVPRARGMGVGGRLVEQCVRFARGAGYRRLVLWTNDPLRAARRLYERAGFELTEQKKHHSFGHDLVGQTFALELTPDEGA
jgi:DNA-binding MarR family transcriptional regulator/GNAT superfamily N-acetyltransferase